MNDHKAMKLPLWKVVLYTLVAPIVISVFIIMHPIKVWKQAVKEWYE